LDKRWFLVVGIVFLISGVIFAYFAYFVYFDWFLESVSPSNYTPTNPLGPIVVILSPLIFLGRCCSRVYLLQIQQKASTTSTAMNWF
jgi:hypothetical protein